MHALLVNNHLKRFSIKTYNSKTIETLESWQEWYVSLLSYVLEIEKSPKWKKNVASILNTLSLQLDTLKFFISNNRTSQSSAIIRVFIEHYLVSYILFCEKYDMPKHEKHNISFHEAYADTISEEGKNLFYYGFLNGNKIEKKISQLGFKEDIDIAKRLRELQKHLGIHIHPTIMGSISQSYSPDKINDKFQKIILSNKNRPVFKSLFKIFNTPDSDIDCIVSSYNHARFSFDETLHRCLIGVMLELSYSFMIKAREYRTCNNRIVFNQLDDMFLIVEENSLSK